MGWASGAEIAIVVVEVVHQYVRSKEARREIYEEFYRAMKQQDFDAEEETRDLDPVWDQLLSDYGYGPDEEDSD